MNGYVFVVLVLVVLALALIARCDVRRAIEQAPRATVGTKVEPPREQAPPADAPDRKPAASQAYALGNHHPDE